MLATTAPPARGQDASPALRLLDVPYVPQSVELCGGAAAAMVMRYWGATGVQAESFAALVDREAGGIRTGALTAALRARGWQVHAAGADAELIRRSLGRRHPPIALIEDAPGRFHYVVIVGWSAGRVLLHDPARAPFRVLDEARFMQAWNRSGNWVLLALPGEGAAAHRAGDPPPAAPPETVCGGLLAAGVRLAGDGALNDAREVLEAAVMRCASNAAVWRELAGLHALQKDWKAAADRAREALRHDPGDQHAARILGTSLFLEGHLSGALAAWNRVGEPVLDHVDIRGLERTRFVVAGRALGVAPPARLTPGALGRAAQRLDALPAVAASRVSYTPRSGGLAQLNAAVVERPLLPVSRLHLAAVGLRAAIDREVHVQVASPTGGGEVWHAGWRWWESRPRLSAGVTAPAAFGAIWRVEGLAERETFGLHPSEVQEDRRRLLVGVSDWASAAIRWDASVGLERWPAGSAVGVSGATDFRFARRRAALHAAAGVWSGNRPLTWTFRSAIDWRSQPEHEGTTWVARGGWSIAGSGAPMALWAGAGTGHARPELLRAHPLLDDGVIRGGVFGRGLVHGTVELRRWVTTGKPLVRVAPALFVDVARAVDAPAFADGRMHADAGAGLRLSLAGVGVLRADFAYGMRDGRRAVSFGWAR